MKHVLAIDQGTTGTTTILFGADGTIVRKAYREFTQHYPQPGWVEHDPMEIWKTVVDTVTELVSGGSEEIVGIGITNQRETTVVWDVETGEPIYPAIVWQCRRTAPLCEDLQPHAAAITEKTGLPLDAYFSGTKVTWILDHVQPSNLDRLRFGTIDTWLIWKLTGGKTHATDFTNASRTLLYNINDHAWDPELCEWIGVPESLLPEVKPSLADYGRATTIPAIEALPILGVAGDQQAALFGQACFSPGQCKNTYGTGCFMMMHTGAQRIASSEGLLTTLAVNGDGSVCYALEGSVFIAGAAIQWLRDELQVIQHADDTDAMARQLDDNGGVYLVPAFTGLGAPYWDMDARGTLVGLTRGTNRNHIVRAALESMAYQTADVLRTMEKELGSQIDQLAVDGGAVANNFLMQFQADILDKTILRPHLTESTSAGAAMIAGLHAGVWSDSSELAAMKTIEAEFTPAMTHDTREAHLAGWARAVRQTRCV